MRTYYNEWDEPTAAWLRELGAGRHLPPGHVDTRSIRDVRAADLDGYDQCHFFAGIGGWPLALRWAGLENVSGIWTGSPPCQPFSVAGKGLAQSDERHLAPVWLDLVKECQPAMLFGEQVADAIRTGWLDDLFNALEREGYACGAAVLPACSVGAPHIRKRLFFGAVRVADAFNAGRREHGRCLDRAPQAGSGEIGQRERLWPDPSYGGPSDGLASTNEGQCRGFANSEGRKSDGSQARRFQGDGISQPSSVFRGLAHASGPRWRQAGCDTSSDRETHEGCSRDRNGHGGQNDLNSGMVRTSGSDPHHGFWSGADWLGCRDGKFRPVEPGTQPLAHGLPARVGRLRGYGNAIVPQVAAAFIEEFMNSLSEISN